MTVMDAVCTVASVWRRPTKTEIVSALYARLRSNSLRPDDTIPLADVSFDDTSSFIATVRNSVEAFDKALPGFRDTYDIFRAFLPDSIVLDIGAHWGYSVAAMRHQGCRAKIISIEAMAANAASLNALKAAENGLYDWINVAVGSNEGTLTFYIPAVNGVAIGGLASTGGTLDAPWADLAAGMTERYPPKNSHHEFKLVVTQVRAARLDTILAERGIADKIAAIKMDIEGHEGPALAGASKLLSEQRPLLMIEGANRNQTATSILNEHGYFHCERHDGHMVPHLAPSQAQDGFFVHPSRIEDYRHLGIFEGEAIAA